MAIAEEPCLYQYYLFLIKDKNILNQGAINESQKLWFSICKTFSIEPEDQDLNNIIKRSTDDIYLDKRVKRLSTFKTDDNRVLGEQLLAHDMLVVCIVINSDPNSVTDTPEDNWKEQLKVNEITKDLENTYNTVSVLQTITYEPTSIVDHITKHLEVFQGAPIISTDLDFGKLWRFGTKFCYLMTTDKLHEGQVNDFLANRFAYIVTIISKIEKHYMLGVQLYKSISEQDTFFSEQEQAVLKIDNIADLERKSEDLRDISKSATSNLTYLKDCSNNIQSNILNLKDAIQYLILDIDTDQIFRPSLELYQEHVDNINSWINVCENSIMRIEKGYENLRTIIAERIEKIRDKKIVMKSIPKKPSRLKGDHQIVLEWGNSYIINENELGKSLNIFKKLTDHGLPGLCITRTYPDKLRSTDQLEKVDIKWLSKDMDKLCVPPVPERLSHDISDFFKTHENSILLLDGLEYIKTNNELQKVIKFMDHLKDLVVMYNTTFILPVYFNIFSDDEMAMLKKNMIDITDLDIRLNEILK